MNISVYEYKNYKKFLKDYIKTRPKGGRGVRSQLAKVCNCQTAYITGVLNKHSHFSMEQGDRINNFIGHSKEESQFFLLLIQFARAGTKSLKATLKEQIDRSINHQFNLKERFRIEETLNAENTAIYFSSWEYAAVHALLSIPHFQDLKLISHYLNIPLSRVSEILAFLQKTKMIIKDKGFYRIGTTKIHIGTNSPHLANHHTNWRIKAIQSLPMQRDNEDLHYSSVVSISKTDVLKIKTILTKSIESSKKIINKSKEEELHCLNVDLFRV